MYSGGAIEVMMPPYVETPNPAWVAGAKAGLMVIGDRTPDWLWDSFVEDIYEMMDRLGDVEATEPGLSLSDDYDGSVFDILGGYVSTAGDVIPEGLVFKLPLDRHEEIMTLLPGITLYRSKQGLVIPRYEITSFLRWVPVRGPVIEKLFDDAFN